VDQPLFGEKVQIGRVLSRAFQVIGRNPVLFIGLGILFAGVPQAIAVWAAGGDLLDPDPSRDMVTGLANIVGAIGGIVLQAAVIRATVIDLGGGKSSIGEALQTGLRTFFPVVGITLLFGILVGVGMVLLLVPGLIALTMFSVAVPAYVEERSGVFASMSRSRELTKGSRWRILGLMVVSFVIALLFQVLVILVASLATGAAIITALVAGGLASAIFAAIVATLYIELRQVKEGADTSQLAEIFA
jgi:hypothetical protein